MPVVHPTKVRSLLAEKFSAFAMAITLGEMWMLHGFALPSTMTHKRWRTLPQLSAVIPSLSSSAQNLDNTNVGKSLCPEQAWRILSLALESFDSLLPPVAASAVDVARMFTNMLVWKL